ncbi:MAG: response regulator, partial [Deltaproteobacteria bacterium]|nr:response regulator [Deltaproteobacteria bacterium]
EAHRETEVSAVAGYLEDYRKIPGVTLEEAGALDALRGRTLVFGSLYSGAAFSSRDGKKAGFLVRFYQSLAGMFGVEVRHKFMSRVELGKAFFDGGVDLTCELPPELLEAGVLRAPTPVFRRQVVVFQKKAAPEAGEAAGLVRGALGFLENSEAAPLVLGSAPEDVRPVYFKDYDQAMRSLVAGEISAFFDEPPALVHPGDFREVEVRNYFPPVEGSLYLASNNPELAPLVSVFQKFLEAGGTSWLFSLYDRSHDENRRIIFEDGLGDELGDYLRRLRQAGAPLRVASKGYDYPESFHNARTGRFEGIAIDVLDDLRDVTGLDYEIVSAPGASYDELKLLLSTGRADILGPVDFLEEREGGNFLLSRPFSYDRYAVISLRGTPDLKFSQIAYVRVGLVPGVVFSDIFAMWFPAKTNAPVFPDMEEATRALRLGKIDYLMGSRNYLLSLHNYHEEPLYKLALTFDEEVPSGYAYRPEDGRLRNLVDEAMAYVDSYQIQSQWTSRMFNYNRKFFRDVVPLLAAFTVLLAAGVLVLTRMNEKNKRLNKNLEGLVEARTGELRKAKDELANEKNFLSIILQTCPVSLVITREGEISYINPFAQRAFGKRKGDRWADSFADDEVRRNFLERLEVGGGIDWRPVTLKKADGGRCEALLNTFHIHYHGVRSHANWLNDVTELRRKARELVQAREAAENSSRAKSELLANMSHEIRTPMNAILGLTRLALQTDLDDGQREYLEKTMSAAASLLGIINDILDFSKIEAGKIEMERIPFRLGEVLESAVNLFVFKAREKKIELILDVRPGAPSRLLGDPLRLGQILNNLMGNAMKFTETGSVTLVVEGAGTAGSEVLVKFQIVDTGIGLSKEQSDKLFKAFSQADSSFTRRYGGTGLGLAISKSLVEIMGGRIWVDGRPKVGCTFGFTVRLGLDERSSPDPGPGRPLAGLKVLAVDDYEPSLRVVAGYLEALGAEVLTAGGAAEALGRLAPGGFAAVVMDMDRPGIPALELAREIRGLFPPAAPRGPGGGPVSGARAAPPGAGPGPPPVLLVTSADRAEAESMIGKALGDSRGGGTVVGKPASLHSLRAAMAEALGEPDGKGAGPGRKRAGGRLGVDVSRLRGRRILLAEDNEINQLVATRLLTNAGLEVDLAKNGLEAVEKVRRRDYDLVLMDIQMPEMDGLTATRTIRGLPGFQDLPVVAMTAHAMLGDKEQSLAAGMNDHVTKPINFEELFATLNRWIVDGPA